MVAVRERLPVVTIAAVAGLLVTLTISRTWISVGRPRRWHGGLGSTIVRIHFR